MSNATPRNIGPYSVSREIGRGGMGVVYLARDNRLERDVAIKALPEHLESDPDRLARFQREARALASMNHPNIGAIHGLEVDGERHYLVLEFVEGETLDARLARGPMDNAEAIEIAIQIASALEAAHDKGIVHRDLKPANVMLTPDGTAKVLDFGLARTPEPAGSSTDVTVPPDSPTLTSPMPVHSPTIPGAIMGTAGYMSPEQARGRTVDKRSDIFSFGCVLYEMLTGLRPFSGETVADVLGATLHKELDLGLLPPQTPANVRRVLKRCLAKDKRQRLHDIADVRLELSEPDTVEHAAAPTSPRRDRIMQVLVPILIVVAAWAWINRPTTQQPQQQDAALPVVRFELEFEGDIDPAMISPDGTKIVYTVDRADSWVRTLGQSQPRRLDIPSGSMPLGWGDDSDTLYYAVLEGYELKTLWRFDFSRGSRRFLAEFSEEGFAWGGSHMITEVDESRLVFSVASAGLYEVDREGGTPVRILEPEREQFFITPIALPGTEAILFSNATEGKVELLESGERTTVLERPGRTIGSVTYAHPGYIFFEVYGSDSLAGVWAAPFSISQRAVTGSATRIFGRGTVTFSRNGHLVFLDETRSQDYPRELVWVDPEQQKAELAFDQALIGLDWPALNPDGQRVAVSVRLSEAEMPRDLNILNLATGARFQLADNRGSDFDPAWRADGETLLFSTWNAGIRELRERRADGSDVARVLDDAVIRFSISAEDKYLLVGIDSLDYYESGDDTRKVFTDDAGPQFSLHPTTKFITYEPADGQGIILRPFPSGEGLAMVIGERVQASKFNPEGTALYCWRGEDLVAIPIDVTGSQPVVGSPRVLLRASDYGLLPGSAFDFGPDGRLLMVRATQEELRQTDSSVITVIQNWPEALDLKPAADAP